MTVLNEDKSLIDIKSSKPDFNPSINKFRDRLKSISSIDHINRHSQLRQSPTPVMMVGLK